MKYKLIACDLDGTLLNSKGHVSEENRKAIAELAKRGVLFVPTTGRAYYETPEVVRNLPDIRYFISSDGAVVQDLKTGERVEFLLPGEKVVKIYSLMKKCNLLLANHKKDYNLVDKSRLDDDTTKEYNIPPYFHNQMLTNCKHIDNLDDEFLHGEPCEMLSACAKSDEQKKEFFEKIKDVNDIHCTGSLNGIIEIVSSSAGKQNAIKALIDKLGITADEIITVGDSGNDLEMIKFAKTSIAMSNAIQDLKSAASHVGCSNDEHIVKYILDNFI